MSAVDDALDTFENRVVGTRVSDKTFDMYQLWIRRFEMWRPGGEVQTGWLYDFDQMLADSDLPDYPWVNGRGRQPPDSYAYRSRRVALSAVKLWYRLNYDREVPEEVQNMVSGEPDPFEPNYLSTDDVDRAIEDAPAACDCPCCAAALAVTYDCILRAAELTAIRREDIDLNANTLYVRTVKGGQPARVSVGSRAMNHLERLIRERDPDDVVFTNTYGNGWKPESWSTHFRRKHHEAGVHSFGRHTPILHRLENPHTFEDMDPDGDVFGQVFRKSRHQHPSMTNRYARMVGIEVPDWANQ